MSYRSHTFIFFSLTYQFIIILSFVQVSKLFFFKATRMLSPFHGPPNLSWHRTPKIWLFGHMAQSSSTFTSFILKIVKKGSGVENCFDLLFYSIQSLCFLKTSLLTLIAESIDALICLEKLQWNTLLYFNSSENIFI